MNPARSILTVFLIALSIGLAGCLVFQTIDYRVRLNGDGKSGSVEIEYDNVESNEADTAKQGEDFAELLRNWRGDGYLLERMDDGVYIKERSLALTKGILVWKETGIFSDFHKMSVGVRYDDTTRITLGKDQTVLSTNGTVIISKDSTTISWPPHTRDLHIKIQQRDFAPTSHFAEKFRSLRKH